MKENDQTEPNPKNLSSAPKVNRRREISAADLPLHCPMPDMELWDSHPRVFLPVEETGSATCPYCGAEYSLTK